MSSAESKRAIFNGSCNETPQPSSSSSSWRNTSNQSDTSQLSKTYRRSLIEDARQASIDASRDSFEIDEVFFENESKEDELGDWNKSSVLLLLKKESYSLSHVLSFFENNNCMNIRHIETRPSKRSNAYTIDVLLNLSSRGDALQDLVPSLKNCCLDVQIFNTSGKLKPKVYWFPKKISDLDLCQHLITKYNPDLDQDHPGFSDKAYRVRRDELASVAFNYKYGQPLPRVVYTAEETNTWKAVYRQLKPLYQKYACKEFLRFFTMLEKECNYTENEIPQLEDVSNFLRAKSGFVLRPVAGIVTARDFLASLAFRVFQCTQYLRHQSAPMHSPEPDVVHELMGHVPMLADNKFAQFSQEIGLASLGVSDEDIERLATLYWFSVEFGLCKEGNEMKVCGAGLLSSYGELLYAISDEPDHKPFDPDVTAIQPYQDYNYQSVYFVAETFEDAKDKLKKYVATNMYRPFQVMYEPYTQRIEIFDSMQRIESKIEDVMTDLVSLCAAVKLLKRETKV